MLRKCVAEPQLILQNLQEYSCTPCLLNNHMGSFFCKYFFSYSWYNLWKKDARPFLLQDHVDYRYSYDSIRLAWPIVSVRLLTVPFVINGGSTIFPDHLNWSYGRIYTSLFIFHHHYSQTLQMWILVTDNDLYMQQCNDSCCMVNDIVSFLLFFPILFPKYSSSWSWYILAPIPFCF
jgi:hypothetical protein